VIAREPPVASGGRLAGAREDRCPGFFLDALRNRLDAGAAVFTL